MEVQEKCFVCKLRVKQKLDKFFLYFHTFVLTLILYLHNSKSIYVKIIKMTLNTIMITGLHSFDLYLKKNQIKFHLMYNIN